MRAEGGMISGNDCVARAMALSEEGAALAFLLLLLPPPMAVVTAVLPMVGRSNVFLILVNPLSPFPWWPFALFLGDG